jgi:hypothetical protein
MDAPEPALSFRLRSGKDARIEVWDYEKLRHFSSQGRPTDNRYNNECAFFEGFSLFGTHTQYKLMGFDRDAPYSREERTLSPPEIQEDRTRSNAEYCKSLVALERDEVTGLLVLPWVREPYSFWHYRIQFIDVHDSYRNERVGTNLVKALDKSDFVKGRIVRVGGFSEDGERFIKKVIKTELHARDYAVISEDYPYRHPAPEGFGVFGRGGRRLAKSPWLTFSPRRN